MAASLPTDHEWRPRLKTWDHLSPAATIYRYPSPRGRLPPPPPTAELQADEARLRSLLVRAQGWCV